MHLFTPLFLTYFLLHCFVSKRVYFGVRVVVVARRYERRPEAVLAVFCRSSPVAVWSEIGYFIIIIISTTNSVAKTSRVIGLRQLVSGAAQTIFGALVCGRRRGRRCERRTRNRRMLSDAADVISRINHADSPGKPRKRDPIAERSGRGCGGKCGEEKNYLGRPCFATVVPSSRSSLYEP